MPATNPNDPGTVTAELTLDCDAWQLRSKVSVSKGPTTLTEILPLARTLSDAVVAATVNAVECTGEKISCTAGCGACCRMLVNISEVEARRTREVVEDMEEPRRSIVRARFADARQRLEKAGLLARLQRQDQLKPDDYGNLCEEYFHLQIACPFLEDESCSIYTERPITCREYLVTSPAEHCSRRGEGLIQRVKIPLPVFNAVARLQVSPSKHFNERCVPLILAPEWAADHTDDPPAIPGPELLRKLLDLLTQKKDEKHRESSK
jgi:Fe-S-cluster containining protein